MADTARAFGIRKSRKLLAEWNVAFGCGNAAAVFGDWTIQPFAESFESLDDDTAAHRSLLQLFTRDVEPFDCLQIGRLQPTENQLSDVIAALFDRNWGHTFALPILKQILNALLRKGSASQATSQSIIQIQNSLESAYTQMVVRRERRGDTSRSDIDVYTPGSNGFLVCIEHKVRFGSETFSAGEFQTHRLWKDAVTRAAQLNIRRENVIAVFLTPGGEQAANADFIVLTFREFADAVCAAVLDGMGEVRIPRTAASILGFMSYYERM
jgi:hypothetical protein